MAILAKPRKQVHQFKETSRIDPYRSRSKIVGTVRCLKCGSMSIRGRWISVKQAALGKQAALRFQELSETKCPACRQLEDRFAQGVIELHGNHWKEKEELVENTIRRSEKIARVRNDQERVLWTKNLGEVRKVYVTLPELARRIGRELEKSFQGITEYERSTEEPYLRVRWWSDSSRFGHRAGAPLKLKRPSKAGSTQSAASPHRSKSFRGRGRT